MAGLHNTFGIAVRNFTAYPEMPDARALVEYGVKMEQMGFDSLWVWDHILLGVEPNFPIVDSLTLARGRHAYKFGVEFRAGANDERRDRGSSGILTFSPLMTSHLGAPNTGNALAAFMIGEVNAGSVQVSDLIQSRAAYWALYAQDDWRLTSRLTLNYGLRWEAELPRRELNNRMNSFDPTAINPVSGTPGVVTFAGRDGTPERADVRAAWTSIRLSFSSIDHVRSKPASSSA